MKYDDSPQLSVDLVSSSNGDDSIDKDIPAATPVRAKSRATSNYESECLLLRVNALVDQCRGAKLMAEADVLSRLLVDLHDETVSTSDAYAAISAVEGRLSHLPRQADVPFRRSNFEGNGVSPILIALCLGCALAGYSAFQNFTRGTVSGTAAPIVAERRLPVLPVTNAINTPVAEPRIWMFFTEKPQDSPALLLSQNSSESTKFELKNSTKDSVAVYWRDFAGKRVHYMDLQPGGSYSQQTFSTHPWEIVNSAGKTILWFVAGSGPGEEVDLAQLLAQAKRQEEIHGQ